MSAAGPVVTVVDLDRLEREALGRLDGELAEATRLRHRVHQQPRVGGAEHDTVAMIRRSLAGEGDQVAGGLTVRFGDAALPAVALRAELDALPIQEQSAVPWASQVDGVAHLCGHDVHQAALVAALRVLRALELPVAVVGVFQPREETSPSGAQDVTSDDTFLAQRIAAMVGVHLQPALAGGVISSAPGPVNASADEFVVRVHGVPGHGGYPHRTRDPIVAAAALVHALQTLVSRRADPMNPTVVTVGTIAGGDSPNQVPGLVTMSGTVRSFDEHERRELHEQLRQMVPGVAAAYGCTGEVAITMGEPVLRNDDRLAGAVTAALAGHRFAQSAPFRSCGADDFSFYGRLFPSVMVFVGVGSGAPDAPGLHHPGFVPGDETIATVARVLLISFFAAARAALEA